MTRFFLALILFVLMTVSAWASEPLSLWNHTGSFQRSSIDSRWDTVAKRIPKDRQNYSSKVFDYVVGEAKKLPIRARIKFINDYFNSIPYVEAQDNWGDVAYWETPYEFTARGGQCEDYAMAKYYALAATGVDIDTMWMIVLDAELYQQYHAVLLVQVGPDVYILDNLTPDILPAAAEQYYFPIYAINAEGSVNYHTLY